MYTCVCVCAYWLQIRDLYVCVCVFVFVCVCVCARVCIHMRHCVRVSICMHTHKSFLNKGDLRCIMKTWQCSPIKNRGPTLPRREFDQRKTGTPKCRPKTSQKSWLGIAALHFRCLGDQCLDQWDSSRLQNCLVEVSIWSILSHAIPKTIRQLEDHHSFLLDGTDSEWMFLALGVAGTSWFPHFSR